MDDIAHHLCMSKKTVYESFTDKEDIILHIIKSYRKQLETQINDNLAIAKNPVEGLVRILLCIASMIKNTNPALIYDLQKHHEQIWEVLIEFRENFLTKRIKQQLRDGVETDLFTLTLNIDLHVILLIEMIRWISNDKLFSKEKYSEKALLDGLIDYIMHGITTEKGKHLYDKIKPMTKEV